MWILQLTDLKPNTVYVIWVRAARPSADLVSEPSDPIIITVLVSSFVICFFNLPARKKFLRSASTEFSHIQKFLQSMVLIYPNVQWTFTSEKGVIWHVPPQLSAEERFYSLFGQKSPISCFHSFAGRIGHLFKPQHSWRTDFVCEWPTHKKVLPTSKCFAYSRTCGEELICP